MCEICAICGSEISSRTSLERGVGPECWAAYQKALISKIFEVEGNSLAYNWLIKVSVFRNAFLVRFAGTKFRSDFNKSFFESINGSERVSKKQLAIIEQKLIEAGDVDVYLLHKTVEQRRREFIAKESLNVDITRAAVESARREIRSKRAH